MKNVSSYRRNLGDINQFNWFTFLDPLYPKLDGKKKVEKKCEQNGHQKINCVLVHISYVKKAYENRLNNQNLSFVGQNREIPEKYRPQFNLHSIDHYSLYIAVETDSKLTFFLSGFVRLFASSTKCSRKLMNFEILFLKFSVEIDDFRCIEKKLRLS